MPPFSRTLLTFIESAYSHTLGFSKYVRVLGIQCCAGTSISNASCGRTWLYSSRYASSHICQLCSAVLGLLHIACSRLLLQRSTLPCVCGCRYPLKYKRSPCLIIQTVSHVHPVCPCVFHHG